MKGDTLDTKASLPRKVQIAVIGASESTEEEELIAYQVGNLLGDLRVILLTGGRGGVMEAASRGAHEAGGVVVGILPGIRGNQFLDISIRTNMNHGRNMILIESADAVIAVGGSYGTLSEIALALRTDTPVYGLKTWDIPGIHSCNDPEDAVKRALKYCVSNSKTQG